MRMQIHIQSLNNSQKYLSHLNNFNVNRYASERSITKSHINLNTKRRKRHSEEEMSRMFSIRNTRIKAVKTIKAKLICVLHK